MKSHADVVFSVYSKLTYSVESLKGTTGGLKSSFTPSLKRSRFLIPVLVIPLQIPGTVPILGHGFVMVEH